MNAVFLSGVLATVIFAVGVLGPERSSDAAPSQSWKRWATLTILIAFVVILVILGLILFGNEVSSFARLSHRFS